MGDDRAVEIRNALLHIAVLAVARRRRVADEAVERVARTWLVNGIATVESGGFSHGTLWDCLNEATRRIAALEADLAAAREEVAALRALAHTAYGEAYVEGWMERPLGRFADVGSGLAHDWPLSDTRRTLDALTAVLAPASADEATEEGR